MVHVRMIKMKRNMFRFSISQIEEKIDIFIQHLSQFSGITKDFIAN